MGYADSCVVKPAAKQDAGLRFGSRLTAASRPANISIQRLKQGEQQQEIIGGRAEVQRYRMKSITKKTISPGAVHSVPADLRKVLISDPAARAKWEDITPLARNEWICWVLSVKKPETRRQHIERVRTELKEGIRRPCCWPGCPHR